MAPARPDIVLTQHNLAACQTTSPDLPKSNVHQHGGVAPRPWAADDRNDVNDSADCHSAAHQLATRLSGVEKKAGRQATVLELKQLRLLDAASFLSLGTARVKATS